MNLNIYETGPLNVNTYVLTDEKSKEAVIIDVGGSFEKIKQELDAENYNIKYVLNTHGHFDHIIGEFELREKYPDIPVYMHKADLPHLSNMAQELVMWGMPPKNQVLNPSGFIDECSELYIGKNKIQIFHTPGHSAGSLSFYVDSKLFSGDALFYRSIGRTDLLEGDFDTLINSIRNKLFKLPDETIVYPGHGRASVIKDEKAYNLYLR